MSGFNVPEFLRFLRERESTLGEPFHYFLRSGSTNDDAKQAARQGALHGSLFLAEEQTAGRGRQGKSWFGTAGDSLTFSVVVRPKLKSSELSPLTLAAGLAVLDAVEELCHAAGRPADHYKLKWPNDLVVQSSFQKTCEKPIRRKLAGLLLETELQNEHAAPAIVIGVGLNVKTTHFPSELQDIATSLAREGLHCTREELLANVLFHLSNWVGKYEKRGSTVLADGLTKADALIHQRVQVQVAGQTTVVGAGAGIREDGALLVDTGTKIVPVVSGTIVAS